MDFSVDKLMSITPDWYQEQYYTQAQMFDLISRDPKKYGKITSLIFMVSVFNPLSRFFPGRSVGIAPGLNISYSFCRDTDDIADGDLEVPDQYNNFPDMVSKLKHYMEIEEYPNTREAVLLRGCVRDLKEFYGVDIREDLSQFLDAMELEYYRRINSTVSSREELYNLYQGSFGVPQDIALICLGSKLRSKDIPELADLQGRLYGVRDLAQDLPKGIIFIPSEAFPTNISYNEAIQNHTMIHEFRKWRENELQEGLELIDKIKNTENNFRGRKMVNFLTGGVEKYIHQELNIQ